MRGGSIQPSNIIVKAWIAEYPIFLDDMTLGITRFLESPTGKGIYMPLGNDKSADFNAGGGAREGSS
jgi:hypothetical protein